MHYSVLIRFLINGALATTSHYVIFLYLIQNAIQHSSGVMQVSLYDLYFTVSDQGPGLSAHQVQLLEEGMGSNKLTSGGGLGLYIVTLMCERLQWHLKVTESNHQETVIMVQFAH